MANFTLMDCPNCGKQFESDGSIGERCYWCKEFVRGPSPVQDKEEQPMVNTEKPKSWRPDGWAKMHPRIKGKWYEKHRKEIESDIINLGYVKAQKEWGISPSGMNGLRKRWGLVETQPPKPKPKPSVGPKVRYERPEPKSGEFCILITEGDLAKLDNEQHRQLWLLLGVIIRNRAFYPKGNSS